MSAEEDRLLNPGEVAAIFRVNRRTVTRWANEGRLTTLRTLGGHRRYHEAEVVALLVGQRGEQEAREEAREQTAVANLKVAARTWRVCTSPKRSVPGRRCGRRRGC